MDFDRGKLYDNPLDFFDPSGNAGMRLSPDAALIVCAESAGRKLVVAEVQGGIMQGSVFEARIDCIWDDNDQARTEAEAQDSNLRACEYIRQKRDTHNAFIITVVPLKTDQPRPQSLQRR